MKKRYAQKMTTILLTAAMICSSVPVTAETVSENEAVVETEAVDNTQNDSAENEQTDVDINKEGIYVGEYGDSDIEENRADMDADYEQEDQEDTKIEDGTEGDLSYSIYQKSDGTKYAVITDCDESAEGAIEIPKEIKGIVVTSIGEDAFCGCRGLTSITILEGVTSIGDTAFLWCSGLTGITIPASVMSIGYSAFSGCSGLTSITVEAGNMVYDNRDNCNAIIEKETNMLISGCENTKIPASVTGIGDSAFSGCSGLISITIPASVTSIGDRAFLDCGGLTSITIPAGVTSIGYWTFGGCSGLTSIIMPTSVTSIEGCAFIGCSGLTSITIPKGLTSIGGSAFSNCSGLASIEIPASVMNIGKDAFSGCSGLTSITVEAGNMAYDSRDNCNAIIEKGTNTLIKGCNNTKIPVSVTGIGDDAFSYCNGLTSIEIPEGVTSIGSYTFSDSSLTSITIPASVESIGYSSFSDCRGLKDIYYTGTQEQWNAIKFYDYRDNEVDASYVFYYYDEDLDESVLIPYTLHCNSSESIPSATPSVTPSQQPSAAPSATPSQQPSTAPSKTPEADVLPAAGTTLKEKAGREFQVTEADSSEGKLAVTLTKLSAKDKKAKKVTIPKTVTVDNVEYQVTGIAAKAFKNSKKLQSIVIPDTITEIGTSSFEGCKNLKSITIGKNVISIGKNAFKNCKNLKKITVKSTKLETVGKGAFTGINKNCVIKVPKKQLKSYKSLFKGKGQKKSVKITK